MTSMVGSFSCNEEVGPTNIHMLMLFNVGALVYDPVIGQFDYVGQQVAAVPTVQENANIFNFNASFMNQLQSLHKSCGYQDFIDEYLTFPPSGVQPPKSFDPTSDADCNIYNMITDAAYRVNPCYNVYAINQMCPFLWDVLGGPTKLHYHDGFVRASDGCPPKDGAAVSKICDFPPPGGQGSNSESEATVLAARLRP